jgi:GAF domain-containing protein
MGRKRSRSEGKTMLERLRSFLAPPVFEGDSEKTRLSSVFYPTLLVLMLVFAVTGTANLLVNFQPAAILIHLFPLVTVIGLSLVARRGYVRQASLLFVALFWVYVTVAVYFWVGVIPVIPISYFILVIVAGLFVGRREALVTVLFSIATIALYSASRLTGNLPAPPVDIDLLVDLTLVVAVLVTATIIFNLAYRSLETTLAALNRGNLELAQAQVLLEKRVADRTRDLEMATEVGRNLAQLRDIDQLLSEAVTLIGQRFDLYYTQIFLADPNGRNLVLRAGTGEVGATLVADGHRLPISGSSINGRAAAERRAIIVSDTAASAVFRPNPMLPETRSEMAVPLITGGQIVGVLDMQSVRPESLGDDNLPAFEALAGQLAVAIQNARLFRDVARAQSDVEHQARRLALSYWRKYLDAVERSERFGYSYDQESVTPLVEPLPEPALENGLTVPIEVTGQPVGQIWLEDPPDRPLSTVDRQLVSAVAQQVAQQIENLRILAEADRYRQEAEEASRRLTREGWVSYRQASLLTAQGYQYDSKRVRPLDGVVPAGSAEDVGSNGQALTRDIAIRGETIARLEVDNPEPLDPEAQSLLDVVAERLGGHIESLRLTEQTQQALAETARRAEEQAAINNLAQAVSQHLDQDQLLETVYQQVRRLMSADAFIVALYDSQAEMIHFPLVYDGDERFEQEPTPLSPQGTTSRVIRSGEPVLIVRSQEEIKRIAKEEGHTFLGDTQRTSASLLYVPLRTADRTFGVLSVQSYQLNAFSQSDVTLLSGIANHVALALENADLFEQTQATLDETELLYHLSARINSATSLDDLVRVVESPGVAPGARSAGLFIFEGLVDHQNEWLVAAATWALDGSTVMPVGSRIHLPSLSVGTADLYTPDEPLLISDVASDERLDDFTRLTFEQFKTAGAAIIPLRQGDDWVGIVIIRWREPFAFSERHERLYRTLARQMTTALSNRLLLRQTRERAGFLEKLSHVESALSQADSEDEILSVLARYSDTDATMTLHYVAETADNQPQHAYTVARWEAGSVQSGDPYSPEPFEVDEDAGIQLGLAYPNEVTFVSDIEPTDQDGRAAVTGAGDPDFAAAIIVPLQSAARWQGFVSVKWSEPHRFSAEERFIWQQLREPLSAVVAGRRAHRAQVAALEETAVLYQASAQLSVAQSYDDILEVLREHTVLGRQSNNISIMLFDQPWESKQPSWADVLAYWSPTTRPADRIRNRFHVRDFPSIASLLDPLELAIIEDAKSAPGLDRKLRQLLVNGFRARGTLFSPMVVGGQWIGFIGAMYPETATFNETDIRRVRVVSQQAAVAVQGLRNLELAQQRAAEAQLRSDELAILNDMGQMLTSVLDVDATVESIYKHTARLMEASNLYVALYDAAADEVDIRIFGDEEEVTDRSVLRRRAGKGVTEHVINSQKPLLIKENVAERLSSLGIEAIGRLPMAWLGVPMIIGRRVIGVIAVQSFTTPGTYDEHDRDLLTAVASQAAIAIENARLFEQAQAQARRERILREITARVRSASDVESVMRAAVTEVGRALGRQTFVYLGNGQVQPSPTPVEEGSHE